MNIKQTCSRCGARLNYYGICPNQIKHLEEDTQRYNERVNSEKQKQDNVDKMLNSVFGEKSTPFLSTPHEHELEPYGEDKYCCKLCGVIIFKNDL
jgi:hypothetical protein